MSEPNSATATAPSMRPVLVAYVRCAIPLSILLGGGIALQLADGFRNVHAFEQAPRIVFLGLARGHAASVSVTSAIVSLVVWGHGRDPMSLQSTLRRAIGTAAFVSVVGTLLTTVFCFASSAAVLHSGFGFSWHSIANGLAALRLEDHIASVTRTVVDTGLIALAMGFALPALSRTTWSLPAKVVVAWVGAFALRSFAGITLA